MIDPVAFSEASHSLEWCLRRWSANESLLIVPQGYDSELFRKAAADVRAELRKHVGALASARDELAAVAQLAVIRTEDGEETTYSSSHEAASVLLHQVLECLHVLSVGPETSREQLAEGLRLPDGVSGFIARICHERAKLLVPIAETSSAIDLEPELPQNGTKLKPEDVPAAFREGGEPDGEILTVPYLIASTDWPDLKVKSTISNAYTKKGVLTRRIKVGSAYAYLYTELSAWQRNISWSK